MPWWRQEVKEGGILLPVPPPEIRELKDSGGKCSGVFAIFSIMHGSLLPVTIPPPAYPREFAILFSLGGLFPTPGHVERDISPPPGLLIDHKYLVLCTKHR